jgi:hypothetical protein
MKRLLYAFAPVAKTNRQEDGFLRRNAMQCVRNIHKVSHKHGAATLKAEECPSVVKTRVAGPSALLVNLYQTARCHRLEYL